MPLTHRNIAKLGIVLLTPLAAGLAWAQNQTPANRPPVPVPVIQQNGLNYVWIPPGAFTMGCSPGDGGCADDEKPSHPVTITKGFWLGQMNSCPPA